MMSIPYHHATICASFRCIAVVAEYDYATDIAVQRAEERKIAYTEGFHQKAVEMAKLMRTHNYSVAKICLMTGLSKEEVEAIK